MKKNNSLRKCRRCGNRKPKEVFMDISGQLNPRGGYCVDCHQVRMEEWKQAAKEAKEKKLRKLKIIYGKWWRHYCLPQEFADDIYNERDFCPYCGDMLPPQYVGEDSSSTPFRGRAQLDHMDPINLGGEDSVRNVVYICDNCNYKKGRRSFLEWLKILDTKYQTLIRDIYETKHGHPPESFKPGEAIERCNGLDAELDMDEEELRKLYPKPIVNGPPTSNDISITISISVDNDGNLKFNPTTDSY